MSKFDNEEEGTERWYDIQRERKFALMPLILTSVTLDEAQLVFLQEATDESKRPEAGSDEFRRWSTGIHKALFSVLKEHGYYAWSIKGWVRTGNVLTAEFHEQSKVYGEHREFLNIPRDEHLMLLVYALSPLAVTHSLTVSDIMIRAKKLSKEIQSYIEAEAKADRV